MLCTPVVCGHTSPTELCYGFRMPPFFPLKRGLPPKNTSLSAGSRWCSPVARRMARSGVRSQYSSPNYYIPGEHSKLPWLTHKAHIGVLHTPNRWCANTPGHFWCALPSKSFVHVVQMDAFVPLTPTTQNHCYGIHACINNVVHHISIIISV